MKSKLFHREEKPACIIPISDPTLERLVKQQTDRKSANLPERVIHSEIVRDLNKVGKEACRSACGIKCEFVFNYPNNPEHPKYSKAIEIFCENEKRCHILGVKAVEAHVSKVSSSKKVLRKIKKVAKRRK